MNDDDDINLSRGIIIALLVCGVAFFSILLGLALVALQGLGMV